jgi:ATP-dependent 26S proteasome regulatory subunit
MRPGRIDTVVPFRAPDAEAAARLVKLYGRDMLSPNNDFMAIGERLQGKTPSVIREIVEYSKMATIARLAGRDVIFGRVNEQDVFDAAIAKEAHERLLTEDKPTAEKFGFNQLILEVERHGNQQGRLE